MGVWGGGGDYWCGRISGFDFQQGGDGGGAAVQKTKSVKVYYFGSWKVFITDKERADEDTRMSLPV